MGVFMSNQRGELVFVYLRSTIRIFTLLTGIFPYILKPCIEKDVQTGVIWEYHLRNPIRTSA